MQTESVKYWTLKRILGYVLILILMPVTLMVSWHFGDRKYYLCSLILIVYSIIPFLLSYEKKETPGKRAGNDRRDVCHCSGFQSCVYHASAF